MRSYYLLLLPVMLFMNVAIAQKISTSNYTFDRAPLKQDVYVQLPLGSIKAKGWLLKQLELQKDGFTGHAEELYSGDNELGINSDWIGGKGNSWEKLPYYVKGLVALAYTMDDADLKAKAEKWINYTLDHQQENGLFGPADMKDWWPRMPFMYAAQSYYEATNDKRVLPFLAKYLKYELDNLDKDPLKEWGRARAGDNMEIALWVYNKTGDKKLLELVNKLKEQAYPWADIFNNGQFAYYGSDFHPKHMVNVAQALKFPAVYAQVDPSPKYMDAMQNGIDHIMQYAGQPEGIGAGTEFMSGRSSVEGVETCAVVEWMQSLETGARIIHQSSLGDQLEKLAFNALPAQFSCDLKNHTYYTYPNQVQSVYGPHGFNQDYKNGIVPSPYSGFPCCRYNMHMGWPYFVKNSWMATPDGGLAVNAYAPMEVSARVAQNIPVKITEDTNYPFDEQINLGIFLQNTAVFALRLRIPAWCLEPVVKVNGKPIAGVKSGEIFALKCAWKNGDQVTLNFPMHITIQPQLSNAVSVERGPLVYALKITPIQKNVKEYLVKGFFETEITPASPWNYGLLLGSGTLDKNITVVKNPISANPFMQAETPVQLKVKAKLIPSWTMDYRGTAAFDVPFGPVLSNEKTEEVTLVPYGSESLRVSILPVIGTPDYATKTYTQTFDHNTANGLINYGGIWFCKDNAIHAGVNEDGGSGGNGTKIIVSGTRFGDLLYSADVMISTAGDAGLVFRVSDPAIGADAYKGYYVGLNATSGVIELGKASNNKWISIAKTNYPLKLAETYAVKVKAVGSKFEVFINGSDQPAITGTDDEYKTGSIGLRAYKALATMDNMKISGL